MLKASEYASNNVNIFLYCGFKSHRPPRKTQLNLHKYGIILSNRKFPKGRWCQECSKHVPAVITCDVR